MEIRNKQEPPINSMSYKFNFSLYPILKTKEEINSMRIGVGVEVNYKYTYIKVHALSEVTTV